MASKSNHTWGFHLRLTIYYGEGNGVREAGPSAWPVGIPACCGTTREAGSQTAVGYAQRQRSPNWQRVSGHCGAGNTAPSAQTQTGMEDEIRLGQRPGGCKSWSAS